MLPATEWAHRDAVRISKLDEGGSYEPKGQV